MDLFREDMCPYCSIPFMDYCPKIIELRILNLGEPLKGQTDEALRFTNSKAID